MLRLEFGSNRLVASWWMTALTLAGVLLFGLLGRWQWQRAAEKRALEAAFAAGTAAFITTLDSQSTLTLARYTQVRAKGRYEPEHQFLLDNISHGGLAGYEVLAPFRLNDGRLLLVNRGWVPLPGGRRDTLPDISLPEAGRIDITGRFDALPVTGLASGQAAPSTDSLWPKRTSFPTTAQLAAALGQDLEAGQILLTASEPYGFLRDWQSASTGFGPKRHIAYAMQWWGLAALSLFLYVFMNLEFQRPLRGRPP